MIGPPSIQVSLKRSERASFLKKYIRTRQKAIKESVGMWNEAFEGKCPIRGKEANNEIGKATSSFKQVLTFLFRHSQVCIWQKVHTFSTKYSGATRISVRWGKLWGVGLVWGPGAEPTPPPPGRRRIFETFQQIS